MKKSKILSVPLLMAAVFLSGQAFSDNPAKFKPRTFYVEGEVSTGYNMTKGKPMYDLGGVIGAPAFHYTFAYDPNSREPIRITEETDENLLVATGVDPAFYIGLGIDPGIINPEVINLPYRAMPFTIDGNTAEAAALVPIDKKNFKSEFTYSYPSTPITIRDWYSARGMAIIRCKANGKSTVKIEFEDLIPNGVYAAWTIIGEDKDGDGLRDFFSPKAFGGAPNIFAANDKGRAVFKRKLPYCPSTDPDTMSVEISYHVDGATYGAVPSISPLVSNGNSYVSAPVHIAFNVGGLEKAN